tara:strand:- start:47 stop:1036 length:990 start_codon:yes stop_codon:yes gene_type:complete
MIEIVKYKNNMSHEWDSFIDSSINGTIFHRRSFLSYHIDRNFKDASFILKKRGQIISVFPAAIIKEGKEKILFSHPGASFGGLIINSVSFSETLEIMNLIEAYCRKNDIKQIRIIPTPQVYQKELNENILYTLHWKNYEIYEQYYSSIIPVGNSFSNHINLIKKNKSRTKDYYSNIINSNNLIIGWNNSFDKFYPILEKNKKMHNSKPTHSLDELYKLHSLFPDKIKLILVKKDGEIIGGSLLFVANQKIAIIFYNMIDYRFVNLQIASIQVIESIKWAYKNNYKFLDFGISHQPEHINPLTPKMSLIKFKEEFGSIGSLRLVFNKNLV